MNDNQLKLLAFAIVHQELAEKRWGYTSESAYLAGLRSSLEELKNNNLQIKY